MVSVNDGRPLPRAGEVVGLTLRLDRVHLFDPETGARIHRIQPAIANPLPAATLPAFLVAGELQ